MTSFGGYGDPCVHTFTTVVYTRRLRDLFRKRYWVRCFDCDLRIGPWRKSPKAVYRMNRDAWPS